MIGSLLVAGVLASANTLHCPQPEDSRTLDFDTASATAGFRVRAGGAPLRGTFKRLRGQLHVGPGERAACVNTELDATSVAMRNDTFAAWARSSEFFDAEMHPQLQFKSVPFDPRMLMQGGVIEGSLTLRGTTRRQRLRAEPARCGSQPQAICKIRLHGTMRRSAFGMRSRRLFVSDHVELDLRFEAPRAELTTPAPAADVAMPR